MIKSYNHLIGIDYQQANCWEIIRMFYQDIFGIILKNYQVQDSLDRSNTRKIIDCERGQFVKVEPSEAKFGDIILISVRGIESHMGIFVGNRRMLHSHLAAGSVLEPISRWERHITGYYRLWEK